MISIHALREEGDCCLRNSFLRLLDFYPRPPRGGRRGPASRTSHEGGISIHALREEGDGRHPQQRPRLRISIHALREEGDTGKAVVEAGKYIFLSTPSARRATPDLPAVRSGAADFYPRPPRGGRPYRSGGHRPEGPISIHALREEGDVAQRARHGRYFLISIHALREEGDQASSFTDLHGQHFYPRPPRGGRPDYSKGHGAFQGFLSTPSARRATRKRRELEADTEQFLSTPSARRAT